MAGVRVSDTMDDEFGAKVDAAIEADIEHKLNKLNTIEVLRSREYVPDRWMHKWNHWRGHSISLRTAMEYNAAGVLNTFLASQFD